MGADRQIVNDMAKEIRRAGPAIRREVRAHIMAELPKRDGLNAWVARAPVRINVRRGATTAGVSVTVGRNSQTGRADLKGLDAGGVRHPLYGNRKHWYGQAVTPLSISEDGGTPEKRRACAKDFADHFTDFKLVVDGTAENGFGRVQAESTFTATNKKCF